MINKGDKAVCVLCSGTVVCRTSSVKRHFETNHKSFCEKSEPEQKELIASAIKDRNKQSTSMFKYVSKNCHSSAASYSPANAIARHGKLFQEGEFFKEAWLACAASLFDDFDNKDKIIQRIKDVPLSRNTMKDRILKLAENVTDQQKMTLTPLLLYRKNGTLTQKGSPPLAYTVEILKETMPLFGSLSRQLVDPVDFKTPKTLREDLGSCILRLLDLIVLMDQTV
ncbi:general transcription factor II-I repeat domain-containing protein 2A [Trichonephila clavipes]|uniref:General transcription factor II-I repeat domain-containing protein 2A n=1 Tax=Trichonephila clavipes TaxID=2585209 RepID=A0A8X7BGD9_TRICX|nr:general transcription factor II-I repeat domain-containing protein 2A [Trichonephila clavipes]